MPTPIAINGLTLLAEEPPGATQPPVLLVPGMFCGAWCFEHYQSFLAERGVPSYALNLRGHYDSRPVPDVGRVSVNDFAADAVEVARALGRPAVIGHSMGGLVVQKMLESDVVSAAVLLCPAPPGGIIVARPHHLGALLGWLGPSLQSRALQPNLASLVFALALNQTPPALHEWIFERLCPESGRAAREMSLGTIRVDASRLRCPVLAVSASDDRMIVPSVVRGVAKKYGASYWEFANHAHMFLYEPGWEGPASQISGWIGDSLAGIGRQ